jgi:hypothetical protein
MDAVVLTDARLARRHHTPNAPARDRTLFLHIGLHKTGTTSFQMWCKDNAAQLSELGVDYYLPVIRPKRGNGSEIGELILRDGVKFIAAPEAQRASTGAHLADFIARATGPKLLISGEDLSYVRTLEECRRLRRHLGDLRVHVILVRREQGEWWRSYCNQIERDGETGTPSTNSRACLDRTGWLTDFATLETVYRRTFDAMTVLDYGPDMVGKLLQAIGIPRTEDVTAYHLNPRLTGRAYWTWRAKRFYGEHIADTVVGRIKRSLSSAR